MEKIRSLQENQKYQGNIKAKISTIKDRNGIDLTKAEDIKKRWQEYTEELYKKDIRNPDNHDGVITHQEPDILKCKVEWALRDQEALVDELKSCSFFEGQIWLL